MAKLRNLLSVSVAVLAISSSAHGQTQQTIIDFEGLAEGTELSDQYASLGAIFSIDGDANLLPIVGVQGNPRVAFTGGGSDGPLASGTGFLCDPVIGGDVFVGSDIAIALSPPATSVRIFVHDLETDGEEVTLRAFFQGVEVDAFTITNDDPGTTNGSILPMTVSAAMIDRVVLDINETAQVGIGFDFLTINRIAPGLCPGGFTIAQESSPGAGDFDANVLGILLPFQTNGNANEFYGYNIPEGDSWNGPNLVPIADRSHLLIARDPSGHSIHIVHDRAIPDDPDGGDAEVTLTLSNDADGAFRSVEDDPQDFYTGAAGESFFESSHSWNVCCSDGVAYSGIDFGASALIEFADVRSSTPTIAGLSEWVLYSGDGTEIPLALEEGRRVRIVFVPVGCAGDINDDGAIDLMDLNLLLSQFGQPVVPGEDGDCNESGVIDLPDLNALLQNFGGTCADD